MEQLPAPHHPHHCWGQQIPTVVKVQVQKCPRTEINKSPHSSTIQACGVCEDPLPEPPRNLINITTHVFDRKGGAVAGAPP